VPFVFALIFVTPLNVRSSAGLVSAAGERRRKVLVGAAPRWSPSLGISA
jgi:hypothetical protein